MWNTIAEPRGSCQGALSRDEKGAMKQEKPSERTEPEVN
jgi:hypothetical protein